MKNLIDKLVGNDVLVRAVKTFVQSFLAVFFLTDNPFNKEVLVAAAAAGISAVWNYLRSLEVSGE